MKSWLSSFKKQNFISQSLDIEDSLTCFTEYETMHFTSKRVNATKNKAWLN